MSAREREAAKWVAAMRGPTADTEREAFEAWHARPGNADAFARAEDDMAIEGLSRQRIEARARGHRTAPGGLRWALATIAAAGLALGFAWYLKFGEHQPQLAAGQQTPGLLTLADGTRVTLTEGAKVASQYSSDRRIVILTGGRARFEVAHDAARPFTVVAGRSETTALGTIFEVDLTQGPPRVRLVKGSVEVRATGADAKLRLSPGQSAEVLTAGPRLLPVKTNPLPATWLEADHLPLGAVIDAANKANAKPIRLTDPLLAEIEVTGRFDVRDSAALARKLAAALNLRSDERAEEILLSKK